MSYKVPNNIIRASKLLCSSVLSAKGGCAEIGKKAGLARQSPFTYSENGYVPLKTVYDVAKACGVSCWMLSYFKLMEVFGSDSPGFQTVVSKAPISPEDKVKILKLYGRT